MCGSLRCPADHDGLLAQRSRISKLEARSSKPQMAVSPVLSRASEVSGWGGGGESSCTLTRCRQSTLESICSEPLEHPCLLLYSVLYLSHLSAAVVFSQARDALLGEARAGGPRYGLAQ
jgi:hypothetical protein